jgi:RHS repeat-associated protein
MAAAMIWLAAAQTAWCFYNPSTGRWLSRDSIGESGAEKLLFKASPSRTPLGRYAELLPEGPNLYGFVHNNPISFVDVDGRAVSAAVIAALAIMAAVEACALPQYNAAFNRYLDSGDKFKHCWVSCRISKSCGGLITELAGLGKEIRDRAVAVYCDYYPDSEICKGGHGDFWDSIGDLKANQQCIGWESLVFGAPGGWVGALCRRSCEDCCKAKVGYYTGEP